MSQTGKSSTQVKQQSQASKSSSFNVYKYFKVHNPSESQNFLFKCTSEATGSSIWTVRRIVKQSDAPKTPAKKEKIEKKNSVNWMNLI